MRISDRIAVLAAALVLFAPAQAESITDAVPGHPGVTFEQLLRQALPGLKKNDDGTWDSGPIANFRAIDGSPAVSDDKPPQDMEIAFGSLDVATIREDGHTRLLVLTDDNSGGTGFDGVLLAFDADQPVPKFLDKVDAGRDRFNGFGDKVEIAPGTDAIVLFSSHSNSNQSYEMVSPLFLRHGRFETVTTLFVYGESACSYRRTQEASYATHAAQGPYRDLVIHLTIETTPGDPDCNDGQKRPRHSKHTIIDAYRWNAKKASFEPTNGALERLSAANWKRATE